MSPTTSFALSISLIASPCSAWPAAAASGMQATSETTVKAGAIKIHYLKAGSGETTIILLHGWPESSYAWRKVIGALAKQYTVIAPDLRGVGGTDAPQDGYDKATLGEDLHELVAVLKPRRVIVVGHDVGALVTYAYVRSHADEAAGVVLIEAPVLGTGTWESIEKAPGAWHFGFNAQEPLAEQLVAGRQAVFFRYIIDHLAMNPSSISEQALTAYARAYRTGPHLSAGFNFYRTFEKDKKSNASRTDPLATPLLLVGAEKGLAAQEPKLKEELEAWGATSVSVMSIPASGHWVAEEQPLAIAKVISDFERSLKR